ncbi:hypothetical protein DIPPA_21568 [Diplonema papillatum]|nr:hypothetical protein DIPPA_21568 [Diplonema papillatum]
MGRGREGTCDTGITVEELRRRALTSGAAVMKVLEVPDSDVTEERRRSCRRCKRWLEDEQNTPVSGGSELVLEGSPSALFPVFSDFAHPGSGDEDGGGGGQRRLLDTVYCGLQALGRPALKATRSPRSGSPALAHLQVFGAHATHLAQNAAVYSQVLTAVSSLLLLSPRQHPDGDPWTSGLDAGRLLEAGRDAVRLVGERAGDVLGAIPLGTSQFLQACAPGGDVGKALLLVLAAGLLDAAAAVCREALPRRLYYCVTV